MVCMYIYIHTRMFPNSLHYFKSDLQPYSKQFHAIPTFRAFSTSRSGFHHTATTQKRLMYSSKGSESDGAWQIFSPNIL